MNGAHFQHENLGRFISRSLNRNLRVWVCDGLGFVCHLGDGRAQDFQSFAERVLRNGERGSDFHRLAPRTDRAEEQQALVKTTLHNRVRKVVVRFFFVRFRYLQSGDETPGGVMTNDLGVPLANLSEALSERFPETRGVPSQIFRNDLFQIRQRRSATNRVSRVCAGHRGRVEIDP